MLKSKDHWKGLAKKKRPMEGPLTFTKKYQIQFPTRKRTDRDNLINNAIDSTSKNLHKILTHGEYETQKQNKTNGYRMLH